MKHIDDAKILSLHKQKKPANEIAIRFQVHPHTIHRRLKRMGIRSRNGRPKGSEDASCGRNWWNRLKIYAQEYHRYGERYVVDAEHPIERTL